MIKMSLPGETEWMRNWRKRPLGTFLALILALLTVYFVQSSVGPFASNATILANFTRFWDGTRWMVVMFPMLLAMLVMGYLSDDRRGERVRVIVNVRSRLSDYRARARATSLASSIEDEGEDEDTE